MKRPIPFVKPELIHTIFTVSFYKDFLVILKTNFKTVVQIRDLDLCDLCFSIKSNQPLRM